MTDNAHLQKIKRTHQI